MGSQIPDEPRQDISGDEDREQAAAHAAQKRHDELHRHIVAGMNWSRPSWIITDQPGDPLGQRPWPRVA